MKKTIRKILSHLMKLFPMKNTIIFESSPDMADNTYPVYRYMLSKGLNQRFHFLWLVSKPENFSGIKEKNVSFVSVSNQGIVDYIKRLYRVSTAKVIIFSNRIIPKERNKQYSIFLSHGTATKKIKGTYDLGDILDDFVYQSAFAKEFMAEEHSVDLKHLISLGFPRNDALFRERDVIYPFVSENQENFILWLPTFRQHHKYDIANMATEMPFGLPLIQTPSQMAILNEKLKQVKLTLVVKLHPAQKRTASLSGFDHVVMIEDEQLRTNGVQLYDLIGRSSALITDYSSVIYDYLLTERPIAVTMDDFEEYKQTRGLAVVNYGELVSDLQVNTFNELLRFVDELSQHKDRTLAKRRELKALCNDHVDNQSTQRVAEHILAEIDKRFGLH